MRELVKSCPVESTTYRHFRYRNETTGGSVMASVVLRGGPRRLCWAAAAVATVLGLAACTSDPPPALPPVDRSNLNQLTKLAETALLSDADVPAWTLAPKERLDLIGGRIQQACGAHVVADDHIVAEVHRKWRQAQPRPVMDQSVFAYDNAMGSSAVDSAKAALTCRSYASPVVREGTVDVVGPFDIPSTSVTVHTFGYCEQDPVTHATRCIALLGVGQFACRLRSSADQQDQARQTILNLAPAAEQRCQAAADQVGTAGSSPQSSPS
jgi:hypothetical protein